MVRSAAGREYRTQGLKDQQGKDQRDWTCLQCGSLVGPLVAHRDLHDAWHGRVG
ncbi:MAG: hypothetical protein QOG97_1658 [Acidimicrobiaceae bacterium]|nr:hypothetical protein [Acidimicrobiaceae bacterium]